jgi:hypothetical protein
MITSDSAKRSDLERRSSAEGDGPEHAAREVAFPLKKRDYAAALEKASWCPTFG